MKVWIVTRYEEGEDSVIVNVCDSLEAAHLARELDRELILDEDYRPPRDNEDECPHDSADEECTCTLSDSAYDYVHGCEWVIEDHYVTSAQSLKVVTTTT